MAGPFVGQGWRFPILPDENGRLGFTAGEDNVEQSLRILLQTTLGERVMRFDFGCQVSELLFAPGGELYLRLLETAIEDAVRDWEPRVELLEVRTETDVRSSEVVDVFVDYRVRATNTRSNLVFPFYLDRTQAI